MSTILSAEILNARILIVDDQDANITLLTEMLLQEGYTQISSTTDPEAVGALHRKATYDLILLDLQMPVMDGFQVMEVLKTNVADDYLPVI
ncbi:MAG: response regulator, partial [Burkholderiaceae bacterium]